MPQLLQVRQVAITPTVVGSLISPCQLQMTEASSSLGPNAF